MARRREPIWELLAAATMTAILQADSDWLAANPEAKDKRKRVVRERLNRVLAARAAVLAKLSAGVSGGKE